MTKKKPLKRRIKSVINAFKPVIFTDTREVFNEHISLINLVTSLASLQCAHPNNDSTCASCTCRHYLNAASKRQRSKTVDAANQHIGKLAAFQFVRQENKIEQLKELLREHQHNLEQVVNQRAHLEHRCDTLQQELEDLSDNASYMLQQRDIAMLDDVYQCVAKADYGLTTTQVVECLNQELGAGEPPFSTQKVNNTLRQYETYFGIVARVAGTSPTEWVVHGPTNPIPAISPNVTQKFDWDAELKKQGVQL